MIGPLVKGLGAASFAAGGIGAASGVQAILAATWVDALAPAATLALGLLTAFLSWRQRRNESRLSETEMDRREIHELVDALQEENRHQTAESARLRTEMSKLFRVVLRYQAGVAKLVDQLEAEDLVPVWRPDPGGQSDIIDAATKT